MRARAGTIDHRGLSRLFLAGLLFLVLVRPLPAAVIPDYHADHLLPDNFAELVEDARRGVSREERLARLADALLESGFTLGRPDGTARFRIGASDGFFGDLPDDIRLKYLRERDPSVLERPFAGIALGYSDSLFQAFRLSRERSTGEDQARIDSRVDTAAGWKWNISRDVKLVLRGVQEIDIGWGFDKVDQNLLTGTHVRRVEVTRDFLLGQNLDINLVGSIGPRISVNINHNTKRRENDYDIRYSGKPGEFVKEIAAGTIDVSLPGNKYVVFSGGSKAAFGVKAVLENESFKLQSVLSFTKGISETKEFSGARSEQKVLLKDTSWIKHRYFRLPDAGIDRNSLGVYLSTSETNGSIAIGGSLYKPLVVGTDYAVNIANGRLELARAVTRDQNLIATYTAGGTDVPGNNHPALPWAVWERFVDLGRNFVYLKRAGFYSRFERKGLYESGFRNIELTRGFDMYVVNTSDGARSPGVQFSSDAWSLDSTTGLLEFTALEPFADKTGVPAALYHAATDPAATDSVYSIALTFLHRVDSFQLRYNVIAGSERVYLNGQLQRRDSDYRLDYTTGELSFITTIGESDAIRVSYEYKPYANALQRTLFGTRADFKPVRGLDIGAGIFYSGGQKPTGAPQPVSTPDSQLVLGGDVKMDLLQLFGVKRPEWRVRLESEFAYSVHDRNTVDRAVFADMESDVTGYAITRSEEKWWPGSPSRFIDGGLVQAARGRLLYRDYRDYDSTGDYSLESYNWSLPSSQIYGYARKSGPYSVSGGRNESTSEITENSLAFEYDFSGGKSWASAVCPIAGTGGIDLSKINQLLLSLRHQGVRGYDGNGHPLYGDVAGSPVRIYFELGILDEDADGDGVFDREETAASGGWTFNPAGGEATLVGGGRRNSGNGAIDSEDLNGDGVMTLAEESVLFPAAGFTEPASAAIAQGGGWQEYAFRIQNLSATNLAILARATAVRITLVGAGGEAGRIMIDRAWFKGSTWDVLRIDDALTAEKTVPAFQAAVISTRENEDYSANRIFREYQGEFEDLHGTMSSTEESEFNEKSLQLSYKLSNTPKDDGGTGSFGSVTRVYNSNMDFSYYRKMILFMFVKEKAGATNEHFVFRIGNSDDRYYQWRIPLSALERAGEAAAAGRKKWHRLEFEMDPLDATERFAVKKNGVVLATASTSAKKPNLREVNRATVGIDTTGSALSENAGEIWVNEGYLKDDVTKTGAAVSLRGQVASPERNLVSLWGVPVVGPFTGTVQYDSVSSGFRSIGQTGDDVASRVFNTAARLQLLGGVNVALQYQDEARNSDNDVNRLPLASQYGTTNRTWRHSVGWATGKGYFPSFEHVYTRNIQQNVSHVIESTTNTSEILADVIKNQFTENATVEIGGKLPGGFSWSWKASDAWFLSDASRQTNGVYGSWYTNSSTVATATWNKKETLGFAWQGGRLFGLPQSSVQVGLNLFKERENYDYSLSHAGMRALFLAREAEDVMTSWTTRTGSLLSGMGRIGDAINGTNIGAIGEGQTISVAARNFGFLSAQASFTRSARDANFVRVTRSSTETNLVQVNNDTTTAKSVTGLSLAFPKFPLRSLGLRIDRDISFSQTTGERTQDEIWGQLRGDFWSQPFSGIELFGLGSRHDDLRLVGRLAESGNSYLSLNHSLKLDAKLDFGDTVFSDLIPDDWDLTESQTTARNLSSYVQTRKRTLSFAKKFPLRKLDFWLFEESAGKSVQDLDVKAEIGRAWDYNTKQISDTLALMLGFNVAWEKRTTLALSYKLGWKHSRQHINAAASGYEYMGIGNDTGDGQGDSFGDLEEAAGGAQPSHTAIPDYVNWEHEIRFDLGFYTKHGGTLDIFRMKIPIDAEWKHNNEILVKFASSRYDRIDGKYSFSELFERTFYLRLKHSLDYDFSSNWNGVLHLAFVFERWKLLTPSADSLELLEDDFGLSFGFEIGLKMQIRF